MTWRTRVWKPRVKWSGERDDDKVNYEDTDIGM